MPCSVEPELSGLLRHSGHTGDVRLPGLIHLQRELIDLSIGFGLPNLDEAKIRVDRDQRGRYLSASTVACSSIG